MIGRSAAVYPSVDGVYPSVDVQDMSREDLEREVTRLRMDNAKRQSGMLALVDLIIKVCGL
jgi:hypothetical protein